MLPTLPIIKSTCTTVTSTSLIRLPTPRCLRAPLRLAQDIGGFVYKHLPRHRVPLEGSLTSSREDGTFVRTLVQGAPLDQPWGFAVAPKNFGKLSNTLLVSNNTNRGTINAFKSESRASLWVRSKTATAKTSSDQIDQLWGIGSSAEDRQTTAVPTNSSLQLVRTVI